MLNTKTFIRFVGLALAALLCAVSAHAAQLKKPTLDAFNRYVQATERRIDTELSNGHFLYIDSLPGQQRAAAYAQIDQGGVFIQRMETTDNGKKIKAPDGMIHHWLATVFVPGVTLQQTLALVQDYNNHSKYYAPDVERSRLVSRNGDDFHIFYRLRRHKVITVVLDTDYDVHYRKLSPTREVSRSYSTRIAEVANPGEKDEQEKPVDDGGGFMWRLDSYWRFEQRDDGVYIQCEAVSLSRDIPTGLGWLIGPFVESVPRESLQFTLGKTREALLGRYRQKENGK